VQELLTLPEHSNMIDVTSGAGTADPSRAQ